MILVEKNNPVSNYSTKQNFQCYMLTIIKYPFNNSIQQTVKYCIYRKVIALDLML